MTKHRQATFAKSQVPNGDKAGSNSQTLITIAVSTPGGAKFSKGLQHGTSATGDAAATVNG